MRTLIYLLLFAAGFAVGGLFPSYALQYEQRIDAQLAQVSTDIKLFQDIADRYHDGSLPRLIEHHLASDDPTFHDEGVAIQTLVGYRTELEEARAALRKPLYGQAAHIVRHANSSLTQATWRAFEPTLVTSREGLTFAALCGLAFAALYLFAAAGWRALR